jgi:hypothetical protein
MLSTLINKLVQLNSWFDSLKEPKRFLLFMSVFVVPASLLQTNWVYNHPVWLAISAVAFISCIILGLFRIFYLSK